MTRGVFAAAARGVFGGVLNPGGSRTLGLVLDANAIYRGAVLDANGLTGGVSSWDNDPASADRVGLYRAAI